jgi:hypothetical protein
MALLKPRTPDGPRTITLRPYTVLRCPFNGHQVSWCRGLCTPIAEHGACGRLAPHAMTDRTQRAIAAYNADQQG